MPSLVSTWFGTFLVEGPTVKERRLVPQDPDAVATRLAAMREAKVLPAERELSELAGGRVTVHERRLRGVGTYVSEGPVPAPRFDAPASGYPHRLLHEALLRLAVREARLEFSDRDRIIVHEVRALDEIVRASNTLAEHLREWYAVHAPELVGSVRDHAEFARLVASGDTQAPVPGGLGVAPPEEDARIVKAFASGLVSLYDTWAEIEARLVVAMGEVAPNLAAVAGPMLGARLIAASGGLEKLAMSPAGTVQTLGAEDALFRHLKDGSPPPKHGILFQHETVNGSPWWQRGKIARALAGKVSIAAKADAFGEDRGRGEVLRTEFDARLAVIRAQHQRPPQRGPRAPRGPPRAGGLPPSRGPSPRRGGPPRDGRGRGRPGGGGGPRGPRGPGGPGGRGGPRGPPGRGR